jgi:uncharacterized protein
MFPHVMQALHIFEPRYRAMLEEAIEDDRLIALGLLAPGWEQELRGAPDVAIDACLCRMATHQRTPEGTYNVLLLGVRRLRLVRELPPKKLFRVVESEILDDIEPDDAAVGTADRLQRQLLAAFKRAMPKIPDAYEQLDQLLGSRSPWACSPTSSPTRSTSTSTGSCGCSPECDVGERVRHPAGRDRRPRARRSVRRTFPPDFSPN